jgi:hypothetical protein
MTKIESRLIVRISSGPTAALAERCPAGRVWSIPRHRTSANHPVRMSPSSRTRAALAAPALGLALAASALAAQTNGASSAASSSGELPLKHDPRPTTAAITPADLMTRMYVFADDSMLGRRAGMEGNVRGTRYIAAEAARLGLEPAGENGTYFQTVPLARRSADPQSSISVNGQALAFGTDFVPVPGLEGTFPFGTTFRGDAVPVVFGGRLGAETITPEQAAGKLVVFLPPLNAQGQPNYRFWRGSHLERYGQAAAIAVASLEITARTTLNYISRTRTLLPGEGDKRPMGLLLSTAAAERLTGAPLAGLQPGAAGGTVRASARFADAPTEAPARNVVAILRGSDPRLRGEYVAIGAHNDHLGLLANHADHDSLRAYATVMRPEGAESDDANPSPEQLARIRTLLDSLRRMHPAHVDSVYNGADDDGSGSVGVLEIAEAFARAPQRPRRSILFVWHTGEELGLLGSEYFTDHPTVPRDSIVTQLNIDMIGRGKPDDVPNGGPGYLDLIGSRRLSTELGDLVEAANRQRQQPFTFDYAYDANGHPMQIYCRSDHYNYARYGIPITFFTTGGHRDYHEPTDEPQYIDYAKLAAVSGFVHDIAVQVANLDHRVVVDHPKPDPHGECVQ